MPYNKTSALFVGGPLDATLSRTDANHVVYAPEALPPVASFQYVGKHRPVDVAGGFRRVTYVRYMLNPRLGWFVDSVLVDSRIPSEDIDFEVARAYAKWSSL